MDGRATATATPVPAIHGQGCAVRALWWRNHVTFPAFTPLILCKSNIYITLRLLYYLDPFNFMSSSILKRNIYYNIAIFTILDYTETTSYVLVVTFNN